MPVEGRRVGEHAERIVVDVQLAADVLDHDALAGRVMHDVVGLRCEAPGLVDDGGDNDVAEIRLHLVDAGEVFQDPGAELPLGDGLGGVGRGVRHVAGRGGEVEQAGGEAFFIQPVEQNRQAGVRWPRHSRTSPST